LLQQLERSDDQAISVRDKIIEALPNWATADQALPSLIALLADDRVADDAIKALGLFKDARAVEPLLKMAERYGFQVHDALKQIGQPAEPFLLAHLNDSSEKVQKVIIKALGDVGTEKSEPPLKKLARSSDFFIRSDAEDALRKLRQRLG
ncbi:MAG: HEAT repeat domain-containing protein, partial [Pirellulales bacterium]